MKSHPPERSASAQTSWRTQEPGTRRLGEKGTVLDMLYAVRADEAEHRDVNHTCSGFKEGQLNPLYNPQGKQTTAVDLCSWHGFAIPLTPLTNSLLGNACGTIREIRWNVIAVCQNHYEETICLSGWYLSNLNHVWQYRKMNVDTTNIVNTQCQRADYYLYPRFYIAWLYHCERYQDSHHQGMVVVLRVVDRQ